MVYIIIGIIFVGVPVFYLTSCRGQSTSDNSKVKTNETQENPFEGLRNLAFTATPEQLGLLLPIDKTIVFGIVMDWGMNSGIATTVSYQTGDASLYFSSGGGVIGGGQHENVNIAARKFVELAQIYLEKTIKTETIVLPKKDEVKFYLLTNNGIFVGEEQMRNFENKSSEWLDLFEEGNKVITELRLTTEKNE